MNLATIIDGHPHDAVALVSRGQETTYGDLRRQVAGFRTGLVELGIRPGDRIAVACANNWFFVVSYLAGLGAGAVIVPLNPHEAPRELERQLASTGARLAVVGPTGRDAFAAVDRAAIAVERVLVPDGVRIDGAEPVESHLADTGDPAPVVERDADDLAVLIFTAGTSGASRAAMLSHGNLLANIEQSQRMRDRAVQPGDVTLGVLPLFHIFGLNVVLGESLYAGATVVLVERFDPLEALATIRERRVTIVAGAPPMYVAWATMPGVDPAALGSVRLAASGAAKLPEEVADAFEARFGIPVAEGYGLTEASPVVSSAVGAARRGSIGHPLPGVEVRLVDEDGEDALEGDPGEIWVRGPNVFKGYWDAPEATARVLGDDGWLRTGDVAVTDDDGYLYIVDRVKDLVIVSGFNVFPAEVEEVLLDHPGIAEAAVVGEPDPYTGETVKAVVVAAPGSFLEPDEVIAFCAARLTRYKCPTRVELVDAIPRGLGGKTLRRALR